MNDDQFNELLSYTMIIALNTSALLFQQSRKKRLTQEEIEFCQSYLFRTAQALQGKFASRAPFEWPPSSGRSDS